jgi:hypothetical protein
MHISEVEALVLLLEDWAEWHRLFRPNIGFNKKSSGFHSGGISCVDDMEIGTDKETIKSMQYSVEQLEEESPVMAAAIYRRYGVSAVFNFPRNNFEDTLILAHDRLVIICKRKGVVL